MAEKQLVVGINDKNRIVVHEADSGIELVDGQGNKITINSEGITLSSSGGAKIQLDSGGNITLKGTQVDMNSGALTVT